MKAGWASQDPKICQHQAPQNVHIHERSIAPSKKVESIVLFVTNPILIHLQASDDNEHCILYVNSLLHLQKSVLSHARQSQPQKEAVKA